MSTQELIKSISDSYVDKAVTAYYAGNLSRAEEAYKNNKG